MRQSDPEVYNQIALSLARRYDCVYYVDIDTGNYMQYLDVMDVKNSDVPRYGEHFFEDAVKNADKFIHPDDLDLIMDFFDSKKLRKNLADTGSYSFAFRAVLDGSIVHMRHIATLSEDGNHAICCLENVEEEFRKREEQKKNLKSAEMMARSDALTGVKNRTAFSEAIETINQDTEAGAVDHYGVVMCDINDLKKINDTTGHAFGNEAIQSASRLICDVYKHSPVFRIGGDEFVIILKGADYENRDQLLKALMHEAEVNQQLRTGPVMAAGMSVYEKGDKFSEVLERADILMYENKNELKAAGIVRGFRDMDKIEEPIPDERRRLLDGFFGAMYTVSGGGYLYLNDMRYDFSRWSLTLVDDFALDSEYLYHADRMWQDYIHPDDIKAYRAAVDAVLNGTSDLRPIHYRARRKDGTYVLLTTKGFVLCDSSGRPEYFGGIIIRDTEE